MQCPCAFCLGLFLRTVIIDTARDTNGSIVSVTGVQRFPIGPEYVNTLSAEVEVCIS